MQLRCFVHSKVWCESKVDIAVSAAALAAAEPLTSLTKSSAPLVERNVNSADALTTNIATELARKHRRAESTSDV